MSNTDNIANLKTQLRPLLSQEDIQKHAKKRTNRSLSQEREDFEKRILQNITSELQRWFDLILKEDPSNLAENTDDSNSIDNKQSKSNEEENNEENAIKSSDFFTKIKDGVILCKVLQIVDKK